ncbi:uroporphyrinogen-III synthase [Metallosphaera hakonensis]|uniref:uroporphyrinogen-III synthase n=1 Tax=Metallosphaera hakonensis TaxID=79601 RepID=UPI0025B21827|nr:uroporphyrinogen-III synthase [Metallosphaera hakonensis]
MGPETAEELVKHGFNPVYPEKHTSRDLALLLLNSGLSSVVAFRSRRASQDMKEILSPLIDYREFYDYDLVLDQSKLSEVKELLQRCEIDVVVLTSSLIAKSVANFIKDCHKVVTIGPMTSTSLRTLRPELKFIESRVSSIKGTIDVLESLRGGDNFG